jgi:phage terminase large subunit-like protein
MTAGQLTTRRAITTHPAHKYAVEVTAGKIPASKLTIAACQRYLIDLRDAPEKGWRFDEKEAIYVIDWFKQNIRHTGGMYGGQPFELLPWQQFIIWNIFGWYIGEKRRFNYAYIEIPKKNGKTTLAAALLLYMLLADREMSPEVYTAATTRDQARICFQEAGKMIKASARLRPFLEEQRAKIYCPQNFGVFAPLSSDSTGFDGINVHAAVVDEYHAAKTDDVRNSLQSGMIARHNPLHFTITTAGFLLNGPCHKLHKTCSDILLGKQSDDSMFTIIYTMDEGDDFRDPIAWEKANPSMGHSVTVEKMQKECHQAHSQGGTKIINFMTKHLNRWCQTSSTWISDALIEKCIVPPADTRGMVAFIGLDLANTRDITSMAMVIPQDNGKLRVRMKHWLPADTVEQVRANNERHPYIRWAKEGMITLTSGNVTDYQSIRRAISGVHVVSGKQETDSTAVAIEHQVELIGYDRFNASQIVSELQGDGVPMLPYGQGYASISFPMKELERLIYGQMIEIEDDPVLRWMFGNVAVSTDPAGNIKPNKGKAQDKIDGVMALIMAIGTYLHSQSESLNNQPPTIIRI